MTPDRVGLLVIRARMERGSSRPLRAEVRATTDITAGLGQRSVLADPEVVVAHVRVWLEEMAAGLATDEPPSHL